MSEAPKSLRSYRREAWVIPNGQGQLWTDRIFCAEVEAREYIDAYWAKARWTTPKHQPLKTWVQAVAEIPPTPTPQNDGGNDGA